MQKEKTAIHPSKSVQPDTANRKPHILRKRRASRDCASLGGLRFRGLAESAISRLIVGSRFTVLKCRAQGVGSRALGFRPFGGLGLTVSGCLGESFYFGPKGAPLSDSEVEPSRKLDARHDSQKATTTQKTQRSQCARMPHHQCIRALSSHWIPGSRARDFVEFVCSSRISLPLLWE